MMITFDKELCISCGACVRCCPMGHLKKTDDGIVETTRKCIECLHCAAACPRKAVGFDDMEPSRLYVTTPEDETVRLLMSRRSIRSFSDTLPPKEDIEWALSLANYAPSGKNIHANCWTVLWGKDKAGKAADLALEYCMKHKEEAPELLFLKLKGVDLVTCGAPCVIIGWSPMDVLNPVVDPIVAMTTLEMLLKTKGIGTCWGGYLNQITNKSRELKSYFGIPEGAKMQCALMVGYAQNENYPNIPYRPQTKVNWVE